MPYSMSERIRMFICRVFGHFPGDVKWQHEGDTFSVCQCCKHTVRTGADQ